MKRVRLQITVLIAAIGILVVGSINKALGQGSTGITIEMGKTKGLSPQEVVDRGVRLRVDLDKAFNSLPDRAKAGHADEFTAIAFPYIFPGMGLEDAVNILTAAGFAAPDPRGRRQQDQSRQTDDHAIVAEIPQFSGRVFGKVEVYVMLPPEEGLAEYIGRRHRMMYYPRP